MASTLVASTSGLRAPAKVTATAKASRRAQFIAKATTKRAEEGDASTSTSTSRRDAIFKGAALTAAVAAAPLVSVSVAPPAAMADALPDEVDVKLICDAECEEKLKDIPIQTTPSGLQYRDVIVGEGASPVPGFQVVVDYIAKNEKGLIFDNSLEKGKPNDVRVTGDPTSAVVIPGLDEGILGMRSGGVRRLYIPGELAFPKGLASAPGRPRIPPFSPVVFDVKLLYIPGLE